MTRIPRYLAGIPTRQGTIKMRHLLLSIFLLGFAVSDNTTLETSSDVTNSRNSLSIESTNQGVSWGEWSPCSRSCGGGISRQQKKCRKKCKGRSWTYKYKVCNTQPCEDSTDFRAEQCNAFDDIPYSGQLLKWFPHHDPLRPCALICRGEQVSTEGTSDRRTRILESSRRITVGAEDDDIHDIESDEAIVVQLTEKVEDGTRCRPEGLDVCIDGECMKVGCDLRVGSNKKLDACGVCGGNGSVCHTKYTWILEPTSACSETCGGGFKIAMPTCKTIDGSLTDNANCDPSLRPDKILLPCNTHPCTTKWVTEEWSRCSATCGGGFRTRPVVCTEENGNATSKLPDYKCSAAHKPHYQETCNTISCPMWETSQWSDCSASCGNGIRTRTIECRDGTGQLSNDCDPAERPHTEQECKTNVPCSDYEDMTQPLMQSYPAPPMPEKLIDQPIPSESTYVAEEWSPCSVTCGEGIRHREVRCKIFLEFSKTVADLPDRQCSGPKPVEAEKCVMKPCSAVGNSLSYRIDTVGDSGYAESSLTDPYRSSSSFSGSGNSESSVKVAPGTAVHTTYSWKEMGYTDCSATCLGGIQDLIIACVRDDTEKPTSPYLCSAETKPESRIKTCNDYPCPPRWNTSEFSPCMSPCGLGIQTRDVTCIHEVTRGVTNTVTVPNHMCPQPPPVDRQVCNVWDCPVKWQTGKWSKCSKSCGGGFKTRDVICEQVMAQGRKQLRPERDCLAHKPSSKKACNTMPCSEVGTNARPIIMSQNSNFTQENPNKNVDLEIGGTAFIFQGTPVVKIRCPVKNYDKSKIIWKKDNMDIRKSRKYKISSKGALRIRDIEQPDRGLYTCIADQVQAQMHIIVKARPIDQMSNEEVLRSGNTVHHRQGSNYPGRTNSDENLHPDQAAPVYSSYEFENDGTHNRQDNFETRKRQEKSRKKKQRPSALPPNSTKPSGEYITSYHQPGYHESNAASSASTLVPHLSLLISTIKSYLPFYGGSSSSDFHRNPALSPTERIRHNRVTTESRLDEDDFLYENSMDYSFQQKNTAIPDDDFGPDEERIFIDDDAYDVDDVIFTLEHKRHMKVTPEVSKGVVTPAISVVDFELGKPTRHHVHDPRHFYRNQRGVGETRDVASDEKTNRPEADVYHATDSERKIEKEDTTTTTTTVTKSENTLKDARLEIGLGSTIGISSTTSATLDFDEIKELEANVTTTNILETESSVDKSDEAASNNLRTDDFSTKKSGETVTSEASIDGNKKEKELEVLRHSSSADSNYETLSTDDNFDDFNQSTKSIFEMIKSSPSMKMSKLLDESNLTTVDNNLDGPTIGSVIAFSKDKDDFLFEWVTTEWSRCSQTCGGEGFQMRGAQCTVRPATAGNSTRAPPRTVIGATLCEDAGYPVPQKVRLCGTGQCPQWHTSDWTPCETSRCFNWKTAMQRREITCRLVEKKDNGTEIETTIDSSKCDESTRPPQRQECYNDACKGVWRAGEWSECTAQCEEDGIKYRILQCVWFGTKKPAGNACRDISRPPVMKPCRGTPCPRTPEDCKDHSKLCSRVKLMNMCRVPLYQKQCCKSCHGRLSSLV